MKHSSRLFCTLFLAGASTLAAADTITLRSDSWFPYNGEPDNKKRPGYTIEIIRMALEEAGHKLDYQLMPWDESLEQVRAGKFDCVVGAYKSDAPDFVFPQEPLGIDATGFFSLNENDTGWKFTGPESLRNKHIGIISGYSYGDELDAYIKKNLGKGKITMVSDEESLEKLIQLLMDKKIDLIVESPTVFRAKVRQLGMNFFFNEVVKEDSYEPLYFACSPKNRKSAEYVGIVSRKVEQLRRENALQGILAKYGLKDWASPSKDNAGSNLSSR